MLRKSLIEAGVDSDKIEMVANEKDAVDAALTMARAGDLVMIFGDAIKRCWKQIIHFKPGDGVSQVSAAAEDTGEYPPLELEEEAFHPEPDVELVRDERGVMIAREESEDTD
jgi:cyanophycin synthetase